MEKKQNDILMQKITHHKSIVERSKDVSDGEVLITIGDLVLQGGDLLDGLFFLSRSISLMGQKIKNKTTQSMH